MNVAYEMAAARALARSVVDPTEGCIRFAGSITKDGYGSVTVRGEGSKLAHRVTYMAATGAPIPDGLTLDHLCHTRSNCTGGDIDCLHRRCVNPAHLEPVTMGENARRGWTARKPACVNGHPFDEANTYTGAGHRSCRACNRAAARRSKERRMLRAAGVVDLAS